MAANYNDSLQSNRDIVRLMIGDTDVTQPLLQDEEIEGILSYVDNNMRQAIGWCLRAIATDIDKVKQLYDRSKGSLTGIENLIRELDRKAGEWLS